jgi:uncharacterized membrane protein
MRTRGKRWKWLATAAVIGGVIGPKALNWLRRIGTARRAIDMRTTVVVERPVVEVFAFCRDFENFPRIVDGLLSVVDTQDGRSHWAVRSASGDVIEWDATVTKYVPNSVIAWQSTPASKVRAGGLMRFAPLSPTETRVDITVTYLPLKTNLGDALRALVGESSTEHLRGELAQASRASLRGPSS